MDEAWPKCFTIVVTVAGHDPPIDITIYLDMSINPGPQSWNIRSKL